MWLPGSGEVSSLAKSCTGRVAKSLVSTWQQLSKFSRHVFTIYGWWFQPLLKNIWSVGMIIPNIWKNTIRVPNHQPVVV
jgi:hypothetical protein